MSIHNSVNEQAWREVLRWERLHCSDNRKRPENEVQEGNCQQCDISKVKLIKFVGRPRDISLKARFLNAFGYKLPFDRHDWFVDRCGTEQRYIIDFYNGAPVKGALTSIRIDARPALENSSSVMAMAYMTLLDTAQVMGMRSQRNSSSSESYVNTNHDGGRKTHADH